MAHATKEESARCMLRSRPAAWFRDCPIEQRDLDLIKAKDVPWVNYSQASYLRKIVSLFQKHKPSSHVVPLSDYFL